MNTLTHVYRLGSFGECNVLYSKRSSSKHLKLAFLTFYVTLWNFCKSTQGHFWFEQVEHAHSHKAQVSNLYALHSSHNNTHSLIYGATENSYKTNSAKNSRSLLMIILSALFCTPEWVKKQYCKLLSNTNLTSFLTGNGCCDWATREDYLQIRRITKQRIRQSAMYTKQRHHTADI